MRRAWAEGIGTFIVVFAGCGAAAVGGAALGTIGIALAFGLAFAGAALALGPVSGAHLNPAVTVAAALAGRLRAREVVPYVAAQIAGATAGVGLAVTIARGRPGGAPGVLDALSGGFGRHSPGFYGADAAIAAEIGLSALLAFVLLGATHHARPGLQHELSAAAGGVAVTLVHLVGMPVTGLPAHPARALGAAFCAGGVALDQLWVFVLGPIVGGAIAAMALRVLFVPEGSNERARAATERAR
ncbi:aquaporin [Polyangium sp. 6x1]|uniref:aquaporin n=1 Tax=Polyangium sp. 6x1 TaxID=3042689 RepID=UPI0024821C8C|nr:aquaporin [Polyangium sp. 6x1]MDI1452046.1 aquaporin [Polyangium sp. 6x1]